MTTTILKAPFPYFGGKSRVASEVWRRFGNVTNLVEPFFGSGAITLAAPWPTGRTETVNDADALLANFWRALQHDPDAVAFYADWPVNEADLHARHRWLIARRSMAEELMADPDAYDAKIAGWWVWGISQWIGSGWCPVVGAASSQKPHLGDAGQGLHRPPQKRPAVGGRGHRSQVGGVHCKMPELGSERGGRRAHAEPSLQLPHVGDAGRGGHRAPAQQMPKIGANGVGADSMSSGVMRKEYRADGSALRAYLQDLAARLRRVRVCCGDWSRVVGPSVTWRHGLTAVFLDPPYVHEGRDSSLYAHDTDLFEQVWAWAMANGDNPLLRIAVCGYDDGRELPDGWQAYRWKAAGGYGSQGNGRGRENANKEVVWFSPHCQHEPTLFDLMEVEA